jgi:GxxExxY protein
VAIKIFLTNKTKYIMGNLIYEEESYLIRGICFEVHKYLGSGFSEIVYKDALEYEFKRNEIFFEREKEYEITYKDIVLPHKFYADFVVMDKIILEIKGVKEMKLEFLAQAMNYLKVSDNLLALVVNFGEPKVNIQRVVY